MMVFPALVRGLTFTVVKSSEFDTLIQDAANKDDFRLPQTVNPVWTWQLTYNYLKDFPWDMVAGLITTDYRVMQDFFLTQGGQSGTFLYYDPDDNQVGPAMLSGAPNTPLAALSIVTDGAGTYYSPMQRTFGGNFYEDITDLNLSSLTGGLALSLYANGILQTQTTDYAVSSSPGLALPSASFMSQYITWVNYPSVGSVTPGSVAGGALGATTYYVKVTRVTAAGESLPSAEFNLAVAANHLLTVSGITTTGKTNDKGWNVYVSTSSAAETKQNSTFIAYGATWTEPSTGLVTGVTVPVIDTSGRPAGPVTAQFGFYFRVRFATDILDFEKFLNRLWTIGGDFSKNSSGVLKLTTSRPVAL